MKTFLFAALLGLSLSVHAGLPEVAAAEAKVAAAQDELRAAKKALSPTEKAELGVVNANKRLERAKAAK